MPIGRPSLKTPELCAEICERLSVGESLRSICRDESTPSFSTVKNWLRSDKEFLAQYAHAREDQADYLADEVLDMARSATAANANAVKVLMDGIKWHAAKTNYSKYGDRPAETHVTTQLNNFVVLTPEKVAELQERRRALLAELKPNDPPSTLRR